MSNKLTKKLFYASIVIGMTALILFFIFWLPILEWFCKFKAWC